MADPTNSAGAASASPAHLFPYCTRLSSKKLMLSGAAPRVERDVLDASNHCWCSRTMKAVGPDGDLVHPEDCQTGRACFESTFGAPKD